MEVLPTAFNALTLYQQFIIYHLRPRKGHPGKMDKIPVDHLTGCKAINSLEPSNWVDHVTALQAVNRLGLSNYGVGFVFTKDDPFWFIDLDNSISAEGVVSSIANVLLTIFSGAAVEISCSGKGHHIIGSGAVPLHSCKNSEFNIEFYDSDRFVALTGIQAVGDAGLNCSPLFPWFVGEYFKPLGEYPLGNDWTTEPCSGWSGPTDDNQLIDQALNARLSSAVVFGTTASFRDLYEGNLEALSIAFPDTRPIGYDQSDADAALAFRFAYWTGKNCERIKNLMLKSALVRDKWDKAGYLERTIIKMCGMQNNFLKVNELSLSAHAENHIKMNQPILKADWKIVSIADIFTNPPQAPQFLIEDLFPDGLVTLLAGHGGSGKSLLALLFAVSLVMGQERFNKKFTKCRVIYYSAEDSELILRYRIFNLCRQLALDPRIVAENLQVIDATNDPYLYEGDSHNTHKAIVLPTYNELCDYVDHFKADVIVIDNTSDTYNANENNRSQVRMFMRSLMKLGRERKVAVLLLAHVDKQTAREGGKEGYSGSTAFHNSARSRLYLTSEGNAVTLQHKKSNHGRCSKDIHFIWSPSGALTHLTENDMRAQETTSLNTLLSLIDSSYKNGVYISPASNSGANAYNTLHKNSAFPKYITAQKMLTPLLERAVAEGRLIVENYKKSGNSSKRYKVLGISKEGIE